MKWKSGFILLVCLMFLLVTACSKSGGADGDDKNGKRTKSQSGPIPSMTNTKMSLSS
ncbi:hypothetical protein [Paenibacillus larvae]|uniref:hypothetical protein n=1 Tax=Paenibacillus larvae TaxID=1464 RepID=UPI0028921363|nr:hypothetical protein [Paenibacillus larvae]MDT2192176.1 hypothetical protein [Paenibacillus larvae]